MNALLQFHRAMVSHKPLAYLLTVDIPELVAGVGSVVDNQAAFKPNFGPTSVPDSSSPHGNPVVPPFDPLNDPQNPSVSQGGIYETRRVINIHRGFVPYQDLLVRLHSGSLDLIATPYYARLGVPIPPYLWYEVSSTEYRSCLNGTQTPEVLEIGVEAVSFNMAVADQIECALDGFVASVRNFIFAAVGMCFSTVVEDPLPCPVTFRDLEIVSGTEEYKPFNQIAIDLGATVKVKKLALYP